MARGIPLVIAGGIGQIFPGACANDRSVSQGAEALRRRWNWNKWGRNKSLDNDSLSSGESVINCLKARKPAFTWRVRQEEGEE